MPLRKDVKRVLIIGSGPIVIGQACEFDYSGTQACKALMKEGLEVILVNSNPATIMTDPEIATRVYVEPLTVPYLTKIIEKERPDSLIPTLGGQTGLNAALALADQGVLEKFGVKMLGSSPSIIRAGEDREIFRELLAKIGAKSPKSFLVRTFEAGLKAGDELGYPLILRPNYTLGGGGGGIAYSLEEYKNMLQNALTESPTSEVLVEQSILGWKEFELEVMCDTGGTFVVVCSIENFDPCGVHTGDSITVAPQQTLSDRQYQDMRDEARKVIEAVGVTTGGANIQFAVHPQTGERVVIEMNPRVSRSSALASKATGFPIAKLAALVAVGYQLNELTNDITGTTPCCYEPALDYVVTKIPRFTFEKFYGARDLLTTQMKSVGEVMAIGRTFQESLQKAVLSLEFHPEGLNEVDFIETKLSYANSNRLWHVVQAFRHGRTVDEVYRLTQITPWFLDQVMNIVRLERELREVDDLTPPLILKMKRGGFSDAAIARIRGTGVKRIREMRWDAGIHPSFEVVDTCAGEFKSGTPYFYSTYWGDPSPKRSEPNMVAVLGSGPNRIGQGIEFDYSCVRGVMALRKLGCAVAMINSNPETVSTDYDTADELYFEPMTRENVIEVLRHLNPKGFVAQLGGQTSINLAAGLEQAGFKILGSSLEAIDLAEDRSRFAQVCRDLNLSLPQASLAVQKDDVIDFVNKVGFPVIARPSYVLGGRRMEVLGNLEELESYFERYGRHVSKESPLFVDQFLERALEVDVDLIRGDGWVVIGGVVEHIEAAGVHSGDSMGVIPPQRLRPETLQRIEDLSQRLADKLDVIGHLNLQLAVKDDVIYVLEANPRSSRSVPFVAKAAGVPLVDLAAKAMLGGKPDRNYDWKKMKTISVKGVVFPFKKFPEADSILGPEMKSTGETMGRAPEYSEALLKAFITSNIRLPLTGEVFFSLRDKDKSLMLPMAKELSQMGYTLSATGGTAKFLRENSLNCDVLLKVHEGRPHCVDRVRSGKVAFVVNTTSGRRSIEDSFAIRRSCTDYFIPCLTESNTAAAFLTALKKARKGELSVAPL